jgi:transcriptional regulator with XRE-family HTH domain
MAENPTLRRLQLGRELRRLREASGLSIEEAAIALDAHRTKISRVESGKQSLTIPEVRLLLTLFGVEDEAERDRIIEIGREARKRAPVRVPEWVREYVGLEAEAVEIRSFHIDLFAGLLQTEAYARAVASAVTPPRPAAEVERLVSIRMERQARLTSDQPPTLTAVVHESALHTKVGGVAVMRDQLRRLLDLAKLPNVAVRVIPFGVGAHAASGSTFTILRLPDPGNTQVVYLEDLWGADYVDRDEQVSAYTEAFNRLVEVSVDAKGTAAMIRKVMGELQ